MRIDTLFKESLERHEAEIGYEPVPEHWGRGYATEAARAIVSSGV